jgi:hypothetical protein
MDHSEFDKAYESTKLKFISYFKFMFTYRGTADDGTVIVASYGGNADDIYKYEVYPDDVEIYSNASNWFSVYATSKDDTVIFDYSDY